MKSSPEVGPWIHRLVVSAIRRPRLALGVWVLIAAMSAAALPGLRFETSADSVLARQSEPWRFYERSTDLFGGDEVIVAAIEASSPYDPVALERLAEATRRLEQIPGLRRVDSIATVPVIRGDVDGGLVLDPALPADYEPAPEAARAVEDRVRGDRIAPSSLVSSSGSVVAVNMYLDLEAASVPERSVSAVREVMDAERGWISGVPVFRAEANEQTRTEMFVFVPLTLAMVGLLVGFVTRSLRGPLVSFSVSGVGTLVMCATMAVLDQPLNLGTIILPSVVLALGSAYVMHVLAAARGVRTPEALENALAGVAGPVALSGLTTGIGFLAISTVRIDVVQAVGMFGAIGVVAVTFATLTLAPAALRLLPLGESPPWLDRRIREDLAGGLLRLVRQHRRSVIVAWAILLTIFSVGWTRILVETDVVLWFPRGTEIRDSYEAIRDHLSGISPVNIVVDSEDGEPVTRPDVVAAIDGLSEHLRGIDRVGKVLSVADPLRQLHAGFTGSDAEPLPDSYDMIEQYLLLLESVEQIEDVVTIDRSSANVLLRVDDNGSAHLLRVARAAEDWWQANGPPGFRARATGIMYEFARAEDEISRGQILGLGLAALAIGVVMMVVLRRPSVALMAALPNLIPIFIAFGFMGLVGIPLDALTILLGSLALGIAVDDTIHVVFGYSERRKLGISASDALRDTFRAVLPALVFTTIAIGVGFGVLGLSEFMPIRNLGLVTSALVSLCLLADLTLLPALLFVSRRPVDAAGSPVPPSYPGARRLDA